MKDSLLGIVPMKMKDAGDLPETPSQQVCRSLAGDLVKKGSLLGAFQ